ncbi:hypothetical protein BGZ60DRAFT_569392 [Tricladium varicosporioides]|nr:hypothetical protein BGZ60DRAFT_569392 [Hymenoscyphus varicosporioides]
MRGTSTIICALLAYIHQSYANLDIITLNTNSGTWIQEAEATLVVGDVPNPMTGDVALWSAIMTDKGDFLQGVTENAEPSPYCTNLGRNWCTFAYDLVGSQVAKNGTPKIAPPRSRIRTHYKLNPQTNLWDQNVYINDTLVSSISTSKGYHGTIFYISVECAAGSCAPAPAHTWENISIVLSKADQSFYHSGGWKYQATGGKMTTSDSGKSWNFTTLNIPQTRPN